MVRRLRTQAECCDAARCWHAAAHIRLTGFRKAGVSVGRRTGWSTGLGPAAAELRPRDSRGPSPGIHCHNVRWDGGGLRVGGVTGSCCRARRCASRAGLNSSSILRLN